MDTVELVNKVKKFEIIYSGLSEFEHLLYIDGDIVIKKDFITELTYNYKYKDINTIQEIIKRTGGDKTKVNELVRRIREKKSGQ